MSALASAPESATPNGSAISPSGGRSPIRVDVLVGLGVAVGLVTVAFATSGDVDQTTATAGNTWTEMLLTLVGAAAVIDAVIQGQGGRRYGLAAVTFMTMLTALTGLSILWSVVPDTSWSAANQIVSYLAGFAGAVSMARLHPSRWRAVLYAMAAATLALCFWALLVKVFPSSLASTNTLGRLLAPFGYWNAVGVTAALGLAVWLWLGTRPGGPRWSIAAAACAISLLLTAVVLSYSRSADAVAVIGLVGWLVSVPRRLRSVAVLALGAAGAAAVCVWALGSTALTADNQLLPAQDSAGHTFGLVLAIMLVLVAGLGIWLARAANARPIRDSTRRRIGTGLVVVACLIPSAAVAAIAGSSRGLGGEVSHVWTELTSTNRAVSSVGDQSGRVFRFGSSRPLYWHQGLDVAQHALLKGVGASGFGTARLRYTTDPYKVDQAHSYIIETLADLGLIGIAISCALVVAWGIAAARPLALRTRWTALGAAERDERAGLCALALVVVGFGVQSSLDWTWYFPGVTLPVLVCAGWLAGRGPLRMRGAADPAAPQRDPAAAPLPFRRSILDRPAAIGACAVIGAVALAAIWVQWQPLRSAQQASAAEGAASTAQAFADARAAATSDPLAYQPHFELAALYESVGDDRSARAEFAKATEIQPENPVTWTQLAGLDLRLGRSRDAIADSQHVLKLDFTTDPDRTVAMNAITLARGQLAHAASSDSAGSQAGSPSGGAPATTG